MNLRRTVAALVPLLFLPALAAERYAVPQDVPSTGTRIKRDAATWSIPFDRPYEKLTQEQKDKVRSAYEGLPANCEPPYPLDGMQPIARDMAKAQKALFVRGKVFAVARVDSNGDVQTVSLFETPSAEMAKIVAYILVKQKFKPAMCGRASHPMDFPVQLSFELR